MAQAGRKIVVAGDDPDNILQHGLRGARVVVCSLSSATLAELADAELLCVSDGSPEPVAAIRFIRAVRDAGYTVPILALGHAWSSQSVILILDSGADSCETGRLTSEQVAAYARALVRRASGVWLVANRGETLLDQERLTLGLNGREFQLTRTQFAIVAYLVRHRNRWRTNESIVDEALSAIHYKGSSVVRFHVYHLRRTLGDHAWCIRWERGKGYLFSLDRHDPATESELARAT